MTQLDLLATSTFGLESVVARELKALGYEPKTIQPGRILFHGLEPDVARANLWLRAADRVLLRLGTFPAKDFGELFDRTYALSWEEWIPADAAFPVTGRSIKSQLSSVPACQKIVKKAVVEKLKAAYGVEWFAETGPKCSIEVALLGDQATLTLDTSGPGLHKRGYRRLAGKAPLKETLAAALVLLSFWRPERPLVDPFCGSGTIPIEAALIGRNIAPGLHRWFVAETWPRLPVAVWQAAREEARDLVKPDLPERIIGTDIDDEALSLARHHAAMAGVEKEIHFQHRSFADLRSSREYGCVICNPPYGQRVGEGRQIESLYRSMPMVLRRLKTWSHYILTSYPDFEALVGQKADRRRKLYNGRIQCTYYQFFGPRPGAPLLEEAAESETTESAAEQEEPALEEKEESLAEGAMEPSAAVSSAPPRRTTAKPAFGGLSAKARHQAEIFRARLANRARHLRRWPARLGITCYRLYDSDVPEIPLAVDRYEECLHIADCSLPQDRTPAEHADWLDLMARTAAEVLQVRPENVFLKRRQRQRGTSQYERVADEQRVFVVSEGGLKFRVNLSDYLDTGLFLDHRITRSMVRELAAGKRFLNLFGYAGSFTVYAGAGSAKSTTTVDLSNTYLDWARENLRLNNLTGPEHHLIRDDVMEFLHSRPPKNAFDLAVVDPPTFSNSKRVDEFFDIQRDHVELLSRLLEWMSPGGIVFFSTHFRRFKFTEAEIAGATIREISRQTVPPDFRNRRIHRCWRLVQREGAEP